jgi:arylamine N-acetyltransferase
MDIKMPRKAKQSALLAAQPTAAEGAAQPTAAEDAAQPTAAEGAAQPTAEEEDDGFKTRASQRRCVQRYYAKMSADPEWRAAYNKRHAEWRAKNHEKALEIARSSRQRVRERKAAAAQ